jgi:hypothetical protein
LWDVEVPFVRVLHGSFVGESYRNRILCIGDIVAGGISYLKVMAGRANVDYCIAGLRSIRWGGDCSKDGGAR